MPHVPSVAGAFALSGIGQVVVDYRYETAVDTNGQTLIPPSLREFANTFARDVNETFGAEPAVGSGGRLASNGVFLTLGDPQDYLDMAGRPTSEGYGLVVNASGITITGASPLGVWWGTRTILQQAILNNGSVPFGSGKDAPGWGTRGMMLDAGRHFYPKEFLMEMCSYMSFFKQNTFHLHLSDNMFNNADYTKQLSLNLYARFRLWSDAPALAGLNRFKNESYTKEDFEQIQAACAARGVTVLPEIESPGHALVIVQWKPELAFKGDVSLLNVTHPDAIPTMQTIWGTFLPWFHTKVVSIGADEYRGSEADYVRFVNAMNGYIGGTWNKTIRIWGTFPPKHGNASDATRNVHQNVSIQHWQYLEDDPLTDYIRNNFSVINSNDDFYVVNKFGSYPSFIQLQKTFRGSPGEGFWYPNIFHQGNATKNPAPTNPYVLGAISPLWNDYGPESSVYSEAYYSWRQGIPALADKQWGGILSEPDFHRVFAALHPLVPGQNLERRVPSATPTILNYTFMDLAFAEAGMIVKDSTPNGYHALTDCAMSINGDLDMDPGCSLVTPVATKGRNYTLTLNIRLTGLDRQAPATLISGPDSSLVLTPKVALYSSGIYFPVNIELPLNEWATLTISALGPRTFASVSRSRGRVTRDEFQSRIVVSTRDRDIRLVEVAIEAPLKQVGGKDCGWAGQISGLTLSNVGSNLK